MAPMTYGPPEPPDSVAQEIAEVSAHLSRLAGLRGVEHEKTARTFRELSEILRPYAGDFARGPLVPAARTLAERERALSEALRELDRALTNKRASKSFPEGTEVTPREFGEAIGRLASETLATTEDRCHSAELRVRDVSTALDGERQKTANATALVLKREAEIRALEARMLVIESALEAATVGGMNSKPGPVTAEKLAEE